MCHKNKTGCGCENPCNPCQPKKTDCIVRYEGPDIDCMGIEREDSFETIVSKVAAFVCDLDLNGGQDGTNGTDGTDGTNGENGTNGNYLQVAKEPPGENCTIGGTKITLYNGETNAVISTNYVCETECDCEQPSPLISNRMWFGDFETSNTGDWVTQSPLMTVYNTSLTHTIATGAGLYEIYIETDLATNTGNLSLSTMALRVNGATPVVPINVQGEGLDNFKYSNFATNTTNTPTTIRLYHQLSQGDTVVPDLRLDTVSEGGPVRLAWMKVVIKKM